MSHKASENKATSKPMASKAAKVLANPNSSKIAKSLAGTALSQAVGKKGKWSKQSWFETIKWKLGVEIMRFKYISAVETLCTTDPL